VGVHVESVSTRPRRGKTTTRPGLAQSDKMFAAAKERRARQPVIVTGVQTLSEITVIAVEEFKKLNVCEVYQRLRITGEVNDLITVLKSGGQILDPIDVAERQDGSWWILDGQQRFWAHYECVVPIRAQIHRVQTLEQEAQLFTVLNSRIRVSSDGIVKAHTGPTATMIREYAERAESPFHGNISFGNPHTRLPFSATTVAKALSAVLRDAFLNGQINHILGYADDAIVSTEGKYLAKRFFDLMAIACNLTARNKALYVIALARVARRHWKNGHATMPTKMSCLSLRSLNIDGLVPTQATRFLPVIEAEIEKRWR
jgi:hypothetical protein